MLQFSMLSDVIVYDAMVTGKQRAGVFTGLWTAAETVFFALGALVLSWLLGVAGFVESDPSAPVAQPDAAITAALYGTTLVPALVVVISVVLTTRYPLTAKKLESGDVRSAEG
ncbi:MFS transporter [Streptosporangium lutulentum]